MVATHQTVEDQLGTTDGPCHIVHQMEPEVSVTRWLRVSKCSPGFNLQVQLNAGYPVVEIRRGMDN